MLSSKGGRRTKAERLELEQLRKKHSELLEKELERGRLGSEKRMEDWQNGTSGFQFGYLSESSLKEAIEYFEKMDLSDVCKIADKHEMKYSKDDDKKHLIKRLLSHPWAHPYYEFFGVPY